MRAAIRTIGCPNSECSGIRISAAFWTHFHTCPSPAGCSSVEFPMMKNSLLQDLSLHGIGWTLFPANPSFLALLFLLLPKTCTFRTTTKYILALLSYSQSPKQRPSPLFLTRLNVGSSTAPLQPQLGTFNWALRESLSPDGNDQNLCLSSPKKSTIRKQVTLLLSQPNQWNAKLCIQNVLWRICSEVFNALCYKYSEAILCKWVKLVNTL